ncbi:MAG: lipid-A-disaccharide synthase N-terminal domain-containing protein [Minwuia sp.]|nr:lipid-A-disaccharide synthase N-terminal domain-containing protein [Minwuia sp.]
MMELVANWWDRMTGIEVWLFTFGLFAQSMFFMRFLVQWIMTERARKSVVPEAFWYFSITGGILMFTYGVLREDPVIMLGQTTGIIIYGRNLFFIRREKRQAAALQPSGDGSHEPTESARPDR